MNAPSDVDSAHAPPPRAIRWQTIGAGLGLLLMAYLLIAYLLLPAAWIRYARRHPALDATPGVTLTGDDHPGDPINVALIGSEDNVKRIMLAAGWFPADPITLQSCLKIAAGTVLKRPYDDAPVSALYLWGRKQDLAFEQPVGDNPRKRHHVRFWHSAAVDDQGRPLWAGSATYDERVGLSHTTGEITHHIAADVDAERDHLFADLQTTGDLGDVQTIPGFHKNVTGKNGGGDPWHTDGTLKIGVIAVQ
jgi:hypothetical protein